MRRDRNTALIQAAAGGDLAGVNAALNAGADVNAKDATYAGATALMWAAQNGHILVVERLLEAGADVNLKCEANRTTALWFAAKNGHLEVVKSLLEGGSKIFLKAILGETNLTEALEKTADENGGEKDAADVITLESCLRYLDLFHDEVEDYFGYIQPGDRFAVLYDKLQDLVIDSAWADAVTLYDDGGTALWIAACSGHADIVQYLIENGADVSVENYLRQTALMMATDKGDKALVELLLQKMAVRVNEKKYMGTHRPHAGR